MNVTFGCLRTDASLRWCNKHRAHLPTLAENLPHVITFPAAPLLEHNVRNGASAIMANNIEKLALAETDHAYNNEVWDKQPLLPGGIRLPPTVMVPGSLHDWEAPFEREDADHFDCKECAKHFRPLFEQQMGSRMYADEISEKAARNMAATFTTEISSNLTYLREKLNTCGTAILNRWSKKNEDRRKELILEASPDLFRKKHPQAHISYAFSGWLPKRPHRATFLLPYLTVEDLSDDKSKLLNLLYYRTQHKPEE